MQVEQKLNQEKETKNKLTEQHNALLEKERLYYKLTKEFFEVMNEFMLWSDSHIFTGMSQERSTEGKVVR